MGDFALSPPLHYLCVMVLACRGEERAPITTAFPDGSGGQRSVFSRTCVGTAMKGRTTLCTGGLRWSNRPFGEVWHLILGALSDKIRMDGIVPHRNHSLRHRDRARLSP